MTNHSAQSQHRQIAEALLVARRHPLALGNELSGLLVDFGLSGSNLVLIGTKETRYSNIQQSQTIDQINIPQ